MDDRSQRLPSAADIAEINAKHLIQTPPAPADLLFVFGTRDDEVLRAETACRLWREGLFRRAIVSGGVTPGLELSECAVIKPLMIERGIPADRILEEHRAANTGDDGLPATITVGAKSLPELRELYARSRFVVVPILPSVSDNGISTVMEAMAMGKAIVSTTLAGGAGTAT